MIEKNEFERRDTTDIMHSWTDAALKGTVVISICSSVNYVQLVSLNIKQKYSKWQIFYVTLYELEHIFFKENAL